MFINNTYQQKVRETLIFLAMFVTPSLFFASKIESFELVKLWFLVDIVGLYTILTVLKKTKIQLTTDKKLVLVFLILEIINLLFSSEKWTTFFGNFHHFSYSFIFAVTLYLFYLFTKKSDISKLGIKKLIIYSSLVGAFYACLELLNINLFKIGGIQSERVHSTFGQPNFYAQYLGVLFLLSLYLLIFKKKKIYVSWAIILGFLLFKTASLSVFISLFTTLFIFILLQYKKESVKKWWKLIILIIFIGATIFLLNIPRLKEQVVGGKYASGIFTNDTAKIRLILWNESIKQMDTKKILVGSGEETFGLNFSRYPIFNSTSEWGAVYNKPHNAFIEYFFEAGILKLVGIILVLIYLLLKLKNNFLYAIPIFVMLGSGFLFTEIYTYFLVFIILKKLLTFKNNSDAINLTKYLKISVASILVILVTLNNIFFFAFIVFNKNPCLSYHIFSEIGYYKLECGIKTNNKMLVLQSEKLNIKDKILTEQTLKYYLDNNYTQEAGDLLEKISKYEGSNGDPVLLYYQGLYFKKQNNKQKAQEYFMKANELIPNFFEARKELST